MVEDKETHGLTLRQLVLEMREDIKHLSGSVTHMESQVVTREELQMWREAQSATKRWAITTIISLAVLGITIVGVLLRFG